jgi:hypothetical protein
MKALCVPLLWWGTLVACTAPFPRQDNPPSQPASSSSSASSAGDAGVQDASTPADAGNPDASTLLSLGEPCADDSACASGLCRATQSSKDKQCLRPCTTQDDCAGEADTYCAALEREAGSGTCLPFSGTHCADCQGAEDCSSAGEVCWVGQGDDAAACHVDCSLAGSAACPEDYTCQPTMVNGASVSLCRPSAGSVCKDAFGGQCPQGGTQACGRTSAQGSCTGERVCTGGRFGPCLAPQPVCRSSCAAVAPAGCTVSLCPAATLQPDACGSCTRRCPGLGTISANVTCGTGAVCGFGCQGEKYDADGLTSTGCEVPDVPLGHHTQAAALDLGSRPCDDDTSDPGVGGPTQPARVVSDTRIHSAPDVLGFNSQTGAAPDWFRLTGSGGSLCLNDVNLTLQVANSAAPGCYRLTVITNSTTLVQDTNGSGTATVTAGLGTYESGSTLYVMVEKKCLTSELFEDVAYTVSGHL